MMDIEKIAALACLSLTPEERERLTREMDAILAFVAELPELDAEDVPADVAVDVGDLREDGARTCLPREALLSASPGRTEEFITVPRVLRE